MSNVARLAPTLSAPVTFAGDAPALGGTRGRIASATGMATDLVAWVFAGRPTYGRSGSYVDERPSCLLSEAIEAGEWEAMQAETFENGFSSWGGYVDGYYTLDVSTYHSRQDPVYRVKFLPAWITSSVDAAAWVETARGYYAEWLLPCPRLAEIADLEERNNVIAFLGTKPRAEKRIALKVALVEWLNGDRDYPREAAWMTRPYDAHRRGYPNAPTAGSQ